MLTISTSTLANESASIFGGALNQPQFDGLNTIVNAYTRYGDQTDSALVTSAKLAYVLATAAWETGRRMQPVRETFAASSAEAIKNLDSAFAAGRMKYVKTPYWRSGYFGRGYVQLTHESNYTGPLREEVLSHFPGKDIGQYPDNAMIPDVSAFILVYGMTKGTFTGHRLSEFFSPGKADFVGARRIINPGDTGSYQKIADYASSFAKAIAKSSNEGAVGV